ncbi:MAG: stage II sporulation protein R [Bacillota bacterium]
MNKRWVWVLILCALLGYLVCAGAINREDVLAKDVLRLHILANSNTDKDQRIKLCVRDRVLEYIEQNAGDAQSKAEVTAWVQEHLKDIEAVAAREVHAQGKDYGASAEIGTFSFPEKIYGEKVYPAGMYNALRVNLGAAKGHNWWCVIFPPLCLADLGVTPQATPTPLVTATPQRTAAPELTAKPQATFTAKAKTASTAMPQATAAPEAQQVVQVIGGQDSYGYENGILFESLFMKWFFG